MTEPTVSEEHHPRQRFTALELQARDALPAAKQARFDFLLDARNAAARTIAEVSCWGFMETARLDRQVLLFERGIENLINDPLQAAQLAADWALRDSEMIHAPGTTDWCSVCTGSEHTAIEMARQIMA